MGKFVLSLCVFGFSVSALAVPRGVYLASPKAISVSGGQVNLSFELPCKNTYPDEWAGNLVAVSDDEGDMTIGLGVVLSKDSCAAGPIKTFIFTYDLEQTGASQVDLKNGVTFVPIDLAK